MSSPPCPLLDALQAALQATAWRAATLVPLPDKGLAHWHVRLQGTGLLARIPKQSQVGLPPAANLQHQAACFERALASGHTPALHATLAVSPQLPRGALLVQDVAGEPPVLPRDLAALAQALAALHALPLPPREARAPLDDAADPLARLAADVRAQAAYLPQAGLAPGVHRILLAELQGLSDTVMRAGRPPRHLIAFDAHPGNFLLRAAHGGGRRAVLVDLEKCRYSHAGLDLAHATLYTSTTWDTQAQAVLSPADVAGFYAAWESAVGPAIADAARPWHVALRRAMGLWSLTWCCKWRALAAAPPREPAAGEDWSARHSEPALVAHVRDRVDHYLSPAAVARVQDELLVLAAELSP